MNEDKAPVTLEKESVQTPPQTAVNAEFQSAPVNYINTPKLPPCLYDGKDRWFALAAAVVGYLVLKTFIMSLDASGLGLMATVDAAAVTLFNFFYCRSLGMKGGRVTNVIFAANLLLAPSFLFCDNGSVTALCAAFIFAGNAYFSYASYKEGSRSVIFNAFRAVVISPFHQFGALFGALFRKPERNKDEDLRDRFKNALPVIVGVLMSIPLCAVVAALLGSADEAFGSIFSFSLDAISQWIEDHIIANIFVVVFSLPISMYIFGAAYSRVYKMRNEDVLQKTNHTDVRVLPTSMCTAFLTPLTILYVIFTAIQVIHVFTANVLGDPDFSYADYARSGFFQLCAVAVINLAVIAVVMFFAKRRESSASVLRWFVVVFCLLTHCLIATALSKMLLYISIYGMTPKRIETSVFMVYLFVMFAVLIVKQFVPKLSFTKLGYCLAALVLLVMWLVPVDSMIARYNIDHWRSGEISWMGYSAMCDLDASAAPVFAEITKADGAKAYEDVRKFFKDRKYIAEQYDQMTAWDFNSARYIAGKVILDAQPADEVIGGFGSYTDVLQ